MLIRVKTAQPIQLFSPKDAYLILRQLRKKWQKYLRVLTGEAKNKILGPSEQPPPPAHLKCSYRKRSLIFVIIFLKLHAPILFRLEENVKSLPIW